MSFNDILPDEASNETTTEPCTSYISNLPDDLLLRIFIINADKDSTLLDLLAGPQLENHDIEQCTRFASQVCQEWRKLILGSSYLWSRVLNTNGMPPSWFEEILRRSGTASLKVSCFPYHESMFNTLNSRKLFADPTNSDRLQVFQGVLEFPGSIPSLVLDTLMHTAFPVLKTCSLRHKEKDIGDRSKPSPLFGKRTPSLRHLELCGIVPMTSATFFTKLTSLHLCMCPVTLPEIFKILQHTTMLQELWLSRNMSMVNQRQGPQHSPIILPPNLVAIRVEDELCGPLVDLLSSLRPIALEHIFLLVTSAEFGGLLATLLEQVHTFLSPFPMLGDDTTTSLAGPSEANHPCTLNVDVDHKVVKFIQTSSMGKTSRELHKEIALQVPQIAEHDCDNMAYLFVLLMTSVGIGFRNCTSLTFTSFELEGQPDSLLLSLFISLVFLERLQIDDPALFRTVLRVLMLRKGPMDEAFTQKGHESSEGVLMPVADTVILLPELRRLVLPRSFLIVDDTYDCLAQFLKFRKTLKLPIAVAVSIRSPLCEDDIVYMESRFHERVDCLELEFDILVEV